STPWSTTVPKGLASRRAFSEQARSSSACRRHFAECSACGNSTTAPAIAQPTAARVRGGSSCSHHCILVNREVPMKAFTIVLAVSALALCAEPKKTDVDLKAADGANLKASYFSPEKPG